MFCFLKTYRFHFEETQGSKITCPIDFPLSDLSVDLLSCAGASKKPSLYDLYGCVNHIGCKSYVIYFKMGHTVYLHFY